METEVQDSQGSLMLHNTMNSRLHSSQTGWRGHKVLRKYRSSHRFTRLEFAALLQFKNSLQQMNLTGIPILWSHPAFNSDTQMERAGLKASEYSQKLENYVLGLHKVRKSNFKFCFPSVPSGFWTKNDSIGYISPFSPENQSDKALFFSWGRRESMKFLWVPVLLEYGSYHTIMCYFVEFWHPSSLFGQKPEN